MFKVKGSEKDPPEGTKEGWPVNRHLENLVSWDAEKRPSKK